MNRPFDRRTALIALGALGLSPLISYAQTDAWPSRPVKLIVPAPPGGPTDAIARLLAERMQAIWKQTVLVDYKPGGGTMIATQFVAKSPADGYTLGMAVSAHMINPSLQPAIPYNTTRDLTGVSHVALAHFGLFAHPSLPVNNVADLIAYARKNPGKLSYATPGIGTSTHLAGEMLNHLAGINMVHVPYKGSAPAMQDVIGGRVPLLFDVLFSSMPFVKDGRMKVLALTSPRRAVSNPEIPLIAESFTGFSAMTIFGVIAPAGVPRDLLHRIGADIASAVKSPGLNERMTNLGVEPVGSSPEEYDALIRTEIEKWAAVVKKAGIKIE